MNAADHRLRCIEEDEDRDQARGDCSDVNPPASVVHSIACNTIADVEPRVEEGFFAPDEGLAAYSSLDGLGHRP